MSLFPGNSRFVSSWHVTLNKALTYVFNHCLPRVPLSACLFCWLCSVRYSFWSPVWRRTLSVVQARLRLRKSFWLHPLKCYYYRHEPLYQTYPCENKISAWNFPFNMILATCTTLNGVFLELVPLTEICIILLLSPNPVLSFLKSNNQVVT